MLTTRQLLRSKRAERDLTVNDMCVILEISKVTYLKKENGERKWKNIELDALVKVLGLNQKQRDFLAGGEYGQVANN